MPQSPAGVTAVWSVLTVAGVASVAVAAGLYRGKGWARKAAMAVAAVGAAVAVAAGSLLPLDIYEKRREHHCQRSCPVLLSVQAERKGVLLL
jgi:hypothetical protein